MIREQVINQIKNYFKIQEFVDQEVYSLYGQRSWRYFDTYLLNSILTIRKELEKPITINNWLWGGNFSQRGLRHNKSEIVMKKTRPYLSAHLMGKAIDFDVKGMKAHKFNCKIRLENKINNKPINWVHLDIVEEKQNPKIYLFNI